jgi:hypothetical protein
MDEPVAEGLLGSQGNIRILLLGEPVAEGLLGSRAISALFCWASR